MSNKEVYEEGVTAFLTGKYRSVLHAIVNHPVPIDKEYRFKFAEGFWWAKNLMEKNDYK